MNAAKRHEIFSRLRAANPHPTTELEYSTPFELLVAVVLSAQSTDRGVNLATRRLFPVASTPEAIYALGEDGLADTIRTIGLYKSKARHLIAASRILIELHGSQVPADRAALEALPGVGRKTANVILGTAFGRNEGVVVDTHVARLARRLGLTRHTQPEKIEQDLMRLVPREDWTRLSHWLIWHGRRRCRALWHSCRRSCPPPPRRCACALSSCGRW